MTNSLNCDSEIDENAATIIKVSNYHDMGDFFNLPIFSNKNQFKVLSFNTESLASKIDHIRVFLESLKLKNIFFDAICINECWLENFGEDLNLEGYSAKSLPQKVGLKGGLVTYIQSEYTVKELKLYSDKTSWEAQFLEISGNGLRAKLALGNIYVPPRTSQDFTEFEQNFLPILNKLTEKYKHIVIAGDTNADALKFNSNTQFGTYFDNITNAGLLPVITLPTHFGSRNGSIIDHIYAKTYIDSSELHTGI